MNDLEESDNGQQQVYDLDDDDDKEPSTRKMDM